MFQALSLFILGLQLYIVAITTVGLPDDIRTTAIQLAGQATSTAQALLNAPAIDTPASTTTPSQPAPSVTITPMPETPTEPAQQAPAPFVRTGNATATLADHVNSFPVGAQHVLIATVTFVNSTNEPLLFSGAGGENSFFAVSNNSIQNWTPHFSGIFMGRALADDRRGILPGETATVQYFIDTPAPSAGAFSVSISSYKLVGLTSGDFVQVDGFPLELGAIEVK